jgi:hypothetical protein
VLACCFFRFGTSRSHSKKALSRSAPNFKLISDLKGGAEENLSVEKIISKIFLFFKEMLGLNKKKSRYGKLSPKKRGLEKGVEVSGDAASARIQKVR